MITRPDAPKAPSNDSAQASAQSNFSVQAPSISLPKGGGAIRGIGEKFAANPVTGTAGMSIPIATSPGRSGFGPQLSLSYDSGSGNGPFGFGWSLGLPSITRKTDKGLPQYRDIEESDVYVLSGAEDLVPVLDENNQRHTREQDGHIVHRYRPRVEGLFVRIERWTNSTTGRIHWRSITRDNVTTHYGLTEQSCIQDPQSTASDNVRIFSWLICQSYDDKGNALVYQYAAENDANVDLTQANERNRSRDAQRYLKRVLYGNRESRLAQPSPAQPDLAQMQWLFEVVFDYGEPHLTQLWLNPNVSPEAQHTFVQANSQTNERWSVRPDVFSQYRPGYEVRTYRRCQRVLMFHHIPDSNGAKGYDGLVRSTEFEYDDLGAVSSTTNSNLAVDTELQHQGSTRYASFIRSVEQCSYAAEPLLGNDIYLKKAMPKLEFEYSKAVISSEVRTLPNPISAQNLPIGLDGSAYQWVDIDGDGLAGILAEQAGAWHFKPNLGDGNFGPIQTISPLPSSVVASGNHQLLDLAGNGQFDVVNFSGPVPGYFERSETLVPTAPQTESDAKGWQPWRSFRQLPNVNWGDPNLRFIDLDGDGHADILITENDAFSWYSSLAEEGFEAARHVPPANSEEHGPRIVFADGEQAIYLADMCGDGLTDIVRIRNGAVCYWPNLGYGRFGSKVTMDNSPWFDHQDQFDHARIRLADIDGSGANDVLYLGRDAIRVYFNQSGNGLSNARSLPTLPHLTNLANVTTVDLLGNGTACLVWSSPLPGDASMPLRFIDLMSTGKPHLLIRSANNLGAETEVTYASSTKFYLQDKAAGRPWISRLPFPVHVVERVTTIDHISRNRFTTRHAYHHGYFDGIEREFRGFGMVEQWDTEHLAALSSATNVDAASHVPPIHTKTWFHTGIYLGRNRVSNYFAGLLDVRDVGEYYPTIRSGNSAGDAAAKTMLLDDTALPEGWSVEEEREACRALKGAMLRQEVYALDGSPKAPHPYTVTEQNFTLRRLQERGINRHGVFFTHAREALNYHFERNPADPRTQHTVTLQVDDFGKVLKQIAIGYGRRPGLSPLQGADRAKQEQLLASYSETTFTNGVDEQNDYRTPVPAEARSYEITGLRNATDQNRFSLAELLVDCIAATPITYETTPALGIKQKRLIEQLKTRYRKNDLSGFLPIGVLESLALPGESYKLALTPNLAREVFVDSGKLTASELEQILQEQCKYVPGASLGSNAGEWWLPSGQVFFSSNTNDTAAQELDRARNHFFLPQRTRDPFHTDSFNTEGSVNFDTHDLLMVETRDALNNRVTVDLNDYRVLQASLVSDPNRNQTHIAFDCLGMVVGTAIMGKPLSAKVEGDSLAGFNANPTEKQILDYLNNPLADPHSMLARASTRLVYDLFAYTRSKASTAPQPAVTYAMVRETHDADLAFDQKTKVQHSFSYSDGFGREIQKKIQAEPEKANGIIGPPRWVGSGWVIFNNKGKTVRQYEPFFTATHQFEFGVQMGVSPVLFYDAAERVVATLHPNHSYEKVLFDPWQQTSYDVTDTIAAHSDQTGDPRTDPDIAPYTAAYFASLSATNPATPWKTWLTQHQESTSPAEQLAAVKAAAHANTPNVAHADALGRPFLTVVPNRVVCANHAKNGTEELFATRVDLDIEGNQRNVIDALNRIVMRYTYDIAGSRIHQISMEAGSRWSLTNVAGNPAHAWDSRGHHFTSHYDVLHRPIEQFVHGTGPHCDPRTLNQTILVDKIEYGETHPNAEDLNLRTRTYQHKDSAGIATSAALNPFTNLEEAFDFKGNSLRSSRQLVSDYKGVPNWQQAPTLDDEIFVGSTRYDALNRPTQTIAPHSSISRAKRNVIQHSFNEANLLERIDVWLDTGTEPPAILNPLVLAPSPVGVNNIDYDAKGQRQKIEYKNRATTFYDYEPDTFRLKSLRTTRPSGLNGLASLLFKNLSVVQDLQYVYDPVGNITEITDLALITTHHAQAIVEPNCRYTYDSNSRLIEATGREHIDQSALHFNSNSGNFRDHPFVGIAQLNNPKALRNYLEQYVYDAVGNFEVMQHSVANGGWTRTYTYEEPSLLEPTKPSNRLSGTIINSQPQQYSSAGNGYDPHGNMLRMPHLPHMRWTFRNELKEVDLVGGGAAHYAYDSSGQRVRKVWGKSEGLTEERLYIGGFEVYRVHRSAIVTPNPQFERETLHLTTGEHRLAIIETKALDVEGTDLSPSELVRYQLGNHLGSSSVELDEAAKVISYEEYFPSGSSSFQAKRLQTEVDKRYRFTRLERDEETGFSYHRARYLNVGLGRWINCDPIGIVGGINLYEYSAGDPIGNTDQSGLEPIGNKCYSDEYQSHFWNNFSGSFVDGIGWSEIKTAGQSQSKSASEATKQNAAWNKEARTLGSAYFDENSDDAFIVGYYLLASKKFGTTTTAFEERFKNAEQLYNQKYNTYRETWGSDFKCGGYSDNEVDRCVQGAKAARRYNTWVYFTVELPAAFGAIAAGAVARGNARTGAPALGSNFTLSRAEATTPVFAVVPTNWPKDFKFKPPGGWLSPGELGAKVGDARESLVAHALGGKVSGELVYGKYDGKTDVDVVDRDGNFISVGGPAKMRKLDGLRRELRILKEVSAARGVNTYFYYAKGTSPEVKKAAARIIGQNFVKPIP
jgi:RHS repeat-associated protein